ncbi:MAG: ATP-binding protein, partial [Chlorobiales bacterium]|nr:ATP-binding protein [Chlorobiales bacterium]
MPDNIHNQIVGSTLNNPTFEYGGKKIRKFLGVPPFPPEVFLGRDDDLITVHDKLFKGDNLLLLVNGEGGIGKTTFASKYYYAYHEDYCHLAWVFAEKSLLDAVLTLAESLTVKFDDNMTGEERLEKLLCEMRKLRKPCLLVIDNANSLPDLDAHYHKLRTCPNVHLLLTTRISEFSQAKVYHINPLDEANAIELFKTHYPAHKHEEDDLLKQILEAVGYNTLVTELLAKNLSNFNNKLKRNYALADLLRDLQETGLLALSHSKDVTTLYQGLRKEKPEDIIAAMYNLTELEETEQKLLSVFAVLPAETIAFATLEDLLPGIEDKATLLLGLAKKGWIEFNDSAKSFKCSPVVQEVTRQQNKTRLAEDCAELISTLIDKLLYEP